QHIANPVCASCHTAIDPIGNGLENYDAMGRYRTIDNNVAIDNTGVLYGGKSFAGAEQMVSLISQDSRFPLCVAQMLFNYSLARAPSAADRCTINRIGLTAVSPTLPVSKAIITLIQSDPFRKRRGDGGTP